MNTQHILIVSGQPISGLSQWPQRFELDFAASDEAAIELVQQKPFEAIVIDDTDSSLHSAKLQALLPILRPGATLFHYSGTEAKSVQAAVREHLRQLRNDRIRQFVVFDDNPGNWDPMPEFSAN